MKLRKYESFEEMKNSSEKQETDKKKVEERHEAFRKFMEELRKGETKKDDDGTSNN